VDACISAIKSAGECGSVDREQSVANCQSAGDITPLPRAALDTVCDVAEKPHLIRECEFLSKEPDEGAAGAGGEAND
jgi:hypothetical protein